MAQSAYNSKYDRTYHIPAVGTVRLVFHIPVVGTVRLDLTSNDSAEFNYFQTTTMPHIQSTSLYFLHGVNGKQLLQGPQRGGKLKRQDQGKSDAISAFLVIA